MLKEGLSCQNNWVLKLEILRLAEENIGHEINKAFVNGYLDELFFVCCEAIDVGELSNHQKERLLSKAIKMVEIKAGSFMMGSPEDEEDREDDEEQHEVRLTRDFHMMKYAVTQVLWEDVMGENHSYFRGASRPVDSVNWLQCVLFANNLSEKQGLECVYHLPADIEEICKLDQEEAGDHLSTEVVMNINANGYRLPTEAEWEYAARGGEDYKYAGSNDIDEVGWSDEYPGSTHGVGQKKANGYGLYDMSGNIWEWCWDYFEEYSKDAMTDPCGPYIDDYGYRIDMGEYEEDEYDVHGRIIRGGNYLGPSKFSRIAGRGQAPPSNRSSGGFRLVKTSSTVRNPPTREYIERRRYIIRKTQGNMYFEEFILEKSNQIKINLTNEEQSSALFVHEERMVEKTEYSKVQSPVLVILKFILF